MTAPCNNIPSWAAIIIGLIGGFVYVMACIFMYKFKIDDPVEAIQVHGFCGAWGVLAVGFFDEDRGVIFSGNIRFLGVQVLGIIALIVWTTMISLSYFYLMK